MRIEVVGDEALSLQARMYAEYRVFAALTQFAPEAITRARVVLRRTSRPGRHGVACTVTIAIEGRDSVRIRKNGPHAYAAINRAVDVMTRTASIVAGERRRLAAAGR